MAGVSDTENKQVAKQWIDEINPTGVLDVGAGAGTYSDLARKSNQHWTALEVFYPYVNMYDLHDKYDLVIIGDARYMDYNKFDNGYGWELAIVADMLEHMSKDDAKGVVLELLKHSEMLLICFPVEHQEQHAGDEGNDFETHVDHWNYEEMVEFLADREVVKTLRGDVLAYFLVKGDA